MAKFRVGDLCIGTDLNADACYNGCECEVLAVHPDGVTGYSNSLREFLRFPPVAYTVRWADGWEAFVHEPNLRKKPPRKEELGTWDALAKLGWKTAERQARKEIERTLGVG